MKFAFLCVFYLFINTSISQTENKSYTKHYLALEAGGMGGYGSLNYILQTPLAQKWDAELRAGLSSYRLKDHYTSFNPNVIIPVGARLVYGKKHCLSLGLGLIFTSTPTQLASDMVKARQNAFHNGFSVGYRVYSKSRKTHFYVEYSPILEETVRFKQWMCLGFAWKFKSKEDE